jgi:hypothetical protein|tara:strand:- start:372 stop:1373 length:1002 start_codon:yes stop_codon:yes gene_type:complete
MSNENPLLNDKTSVTGAAKSIEGLLDPKTATIKPQKEAAPVEPKESEVKAEDTQEVQQQPTEQLEEKVQESVDEEEALEENAIEEQTTDYHQVKVNGEVIEVDLEELKAGYQKDADYRRKTEEVALEKRELLTEKDRLAKTYATKLEDLSSLTLALNAEVNNDLNAKELDKLWDEDPTEAARIDRKIRRRRETLSQAQKRLKDHQQVQFQEILKEEQKKVAMKFPDLQDPVKGNSLRTNMTNYLLRKGFNDKDVSSIYDSRMFEVIVDGMKYQDNKKLKPTLVNKKVKPSKVVRSGVKTTKAEENSQARLSRIKTLKKSGNPKDATDLLMRYL